MSEPTNQDLLGQISNCCLSSTFNEVNYGKPSKESVNKLAIIWSKRLTFVGIEDFQVRSEVDRYIKENTNHE